MSSVTLLSNELLAWRRNQLAKGGQAVDLDWLLDLHAGLRWSSLQKLLIDSSKLVRINCSLEELSTIWDKHLEDYTPLQYLLNICPWRDFELEVNPSVLIPRQETELLVDFAMERIDGKAVGDWADLGTGSGALAVALCRALPKWRGHVVDCSQDALLVAERNLRNLAPNAIWKSYLGNWWEPLKPLWGSLSLVIANPPYIPLATFKSLGPEVLNHEPHLALYGGSDGLESCRNVISGCLGTLCEGGWILVEHHHDQSELVMELMENEGLKDVEFECDLSGTRRFALGRHPGNMRT